MSAIRGIPDYFLERYEDEFAKWAAQIPSGEFHPLRLFTFNEGAVAPPSPDPEQGRQLLGAWLFARLSRRGVEIEPYRESDREAIIKHCERMQRAGIPARTRLVEPARPGIPGFSFAQAKGNGHAVNGQGRED
jgi:hypothetical protein